MSRQPKLQQIGRHSWAAVGSGEDAIHSYGANQAIVKGDRAALVFDTGFNNQVSSFLLQKIGSPKTMIVVDSHYHSDHAFGNSVFTDRGASVIAHEKCCRSMEQKSARLLEAYRRRDPQIGKMLRGVKVVTPHVTYRELIEIRLGKGLNVETVHPMDRAHTDGDSIVNVTTEKVVLAGDVLWVGYHPNLEDADTQGQVQALKSILKMKPRRIVPGHGPVCSPKDVKLSIKYLVELDRNIRSGLRKNLKRDDFVRYVIPSWSRDWKMRWLMESYLQKLSEKN
ncbi:MBL fold metallo-hydrolase [Candidatus Bathyarchaeota archaeon]|nr:MBL fold metallo-hydrolase [Candidatus Bathyarchaeota archaeon]